MVTKILFRDKIRAELLKILSGYCFRERHTDYLKLVILSPWISDVILEISPEVLKLDELWFGVDYGIHSINLPYALLLLKVQFGAEIYLITLPPTEANYGERASFHRNLLDFIDEIGCEVLINPDLHTKLILSNDLALIGSFNLSKAALYDREEIGTSIDDMDNLRVLEEYANNMLSTSTSYGYTATANQQIRNVDFFNSVATKVSRGWLYQELVKGKFGRILPELWCFDQFLKDDIGTKSFYSDGVVKELASDLEAFYIKAIITCFNASWREMDEDNKFGLRFFLRNRLNYQGELETEAILDFLQSRLARPHIPQFQLKITSFTKGA